MIAADAADDDPRDVTLGTPPPQTTAAPRNPRSLRTKAGAIPINGPIAVRFVAISRCGGSVSS